MKKFYMLGVFLVCLVLMGVEKNCAEIVSPEGGSSYSIYDRITFETKVSDAYVSWCSATSYEIHEAVVERESADGTWKEVYNFLSGYETEETEEVSWSWAITPYNEGIPPGDNYRFHTKIYFNYQSALPRIICVAAQGDNESLSRFELTE